MCYLDADLQARFRESGEAIGYCLPSCLLTALQKAGATGCMPGFLLEFCFLHAIQIFRSYPNSMVVTTRKVIEVYPISCRTRTQAYGKLTFQSVRRDSVISKLSTYPLTPPANISDDAMRVAWHQWIRYEMSKRYVARKPSSFPLSTL